MKNNLKKVLLCDASFSALPIMEALKSKGFQVAVCGARASDPCHAIAEQSFILDYSNKEQLFYFFQKNKFDYLVPGCTDVSYLTSAWVANQLELPGYDKPDVIQLIHDKGKFRSYAASKKYPIPKFAHTLEEAKSLNFPILVKPTNSFSGKGIQQVSHAEELDKIFEGIQKANLYDNYLFEEFIDGELFSHSAFIKNKKIVFDFFVNEYCTAYPYQVNSSNLSSQLSSIPKNKIRNWLETFAIDVNLIDGLFHTQFISNNTDVWIIESARRCPGDLYSKLIEYSTGVNYAGKYIESFCNLTPSNNISTAKMIPISRHTVSVKEDCIFISSALTLKHLQSRFVPLKKSGEVVKAAPHDRAGIYFIEHSTIDEMEIYTKQLIKYIDIQKCVLRSE